MVFLVLMCSVVMPLLELSLLCFITFSVRFEKSPALLLHALKWERISSEWGMLEVYMLGILGRRV